MTQLTTEHPLEVFEQYLETEKIPFAFSPDSIEALVGIGFFGERIVNIDWDGERIEVSVFVTEQIMEGFKTSLWSLHEMTDGRLMLDDEGALWWSAFFAPDMFETGEEVTHVLNWIDREMFIAGALLDRFAKDGTEINVHAIDGFGPYGQMGDA